MTLQEYFKQPIHKRMTQKELAQRIDELDGYTCSEQFINQLVNDRRPIPARMAKAIHKVLRGRVKKETMCPDIF